MVTQLGEIRRVIVEDKGKKAKILFDPAGTTTPPLWLKLSNDSTSSFVAMVSAACTGFIYGGPVFGGPHVHVTYDTGDNEVDEIQIHR
ncbi:MAG TPA: hypothetical protein VK250_07580 [Nitrososphaeraceae archaeon]|jgi:hypothetical protein|nr:hypothetical protein [Nitrososphaeraceae archaeon]